MSKIIELAKKLKALADRGVDGEKVNASRQLERIMKKHNLTIEAIEGEQKDYADFKVDQLQKTIFFQVAASVIGADFKIFTRSNKRQTLALFITAAEAVEIQMKYDFYYKLYTAELLIFRHAFFQQNNIFPAGGGTKAIGELSEEEKERMKRVINMAENIKKGEFRKALTH